AWHGGAVDQGGQECGEVDQAVVPALQGQRGALAVVRVGVQPGELPAAAGPAEVSEALDADHAPREADQDRSEGRVAREVHRLPAGRGRGAAEAVRGDSDPDRTAAAGVCHGVTFVAPDKRVRTSSPCVHGALGWPISANEKGRIRGLYKPST